MHAAAAIAHAYGAAFADLPACAKPAPKLPPGELHAWHLDVVRLRDDAPSGETPSSRRCALAASAPVSITCHRNFHPYWRDTMTGGPSSSSVSHRCLRAHGSA
jgi:hypothetical protein